MPPDFERALPGARHREGCSRALLAGVLLAAALSGGCALLADDTAVESAAAPGSSVDAVAIDELTAVLAQALDPVETTVQISRDDTDPLATRLADTLLRRGYGLQRVAADQGAHFLDWSREVEPGADGGEEIDWRVAIGPVEVSRPYVRERDGGVATGGPLSLSGSRVDIDVAASRPDALTLAEERHARVRHVASLDAGAGNPIISLVTPEVVEQVALEASGGARGDARQGTRRASGPSQQALNANQVEVSNLFYGGESNFSSTLDDYQRIDRRIIVFADDSMTLGEVNKDLIRDFVETSVGSADIISLVGCSNGPTSLEIGNEGLALGRARRVTEELTSLGLPASRVYDEGCWAPVSAGERFPGRGVVLELWRRPA